MKNNKNSATFSKKDKNDKTINVKLVSDRKLALADIINIILAFLSTITVLISFCTVCEMKKDRNASYKPEVLINPQNISIQWDENGYEDWIDKTNENYNETLNPDGSVDCKISFSFQRLDDYIYSLPLANIGVGSAKDIAIKWDSNNIQRLLNVLIECDPTKEKFCSVNEDFTCFWYDNHRIEVSNEEDARYMYMLPASETEEIYVLPFPEVYLLLINEIIKTGQYVNSAINNGPFIFLDLQYTDAINNIRYDKKICIQIIKNMYEANKDGSGRAVYQILPVYGQ